MTSPTLRPVIAVDIDDVLFPFVSGIADYHNERNGTTLSPQDFISYDFTEVWGGTADETNTIIDQFMLTNCLHLTPEVGAKSALARLSKDYDVVLVTARNEIFRQNTEGWLRLHFPDLFKDVLFAGNPHDGRPYRSKGVVCKELGAELLIDDHPSNLLSARDYGIDGILYGSKAWSFLEGDQGGIVPCADWAAVIEYIYHDWRK